MNRIWAVQDTSRAGTAHLWESSEFEPRLWQSHCGRVVFASELQNESEALRRCKVCQKSTNAALDESK